MGKSFVKDVVWQVCPVKNKGEVLIYNFNKTPPPLFFTSRNLHSPGIGIKATNKLTTTLAVETIVNSTLMPTVHAHVTIKP